MQETSEEESPSPPPQLGSQTQEFLRALFEPLPPGFIEIRVLEECRPGKLFARHWYESADALIAVAPRFITLAREKGAGFFFGVLPRREEGKGKAEDVLDGMAAWADLDFKDYVGGETEARKRLERFPLPPTAVIKTGHGLHSYWVMKEPTQVAKLVEISAGLAMALGGDHVADAARILRMPESFNCKERDKHLLVELETLDLDRRYAPEDLEEFLPAVEPPPANANGNGKEAPSAEAFSLPFPLPKISDLVHELLRDSQRLRNLFEGRGKPAVVDEKRLDTTSSGYDFSLLIELVKRGITNPTELASVLWHRPDDAARAKGLRYIQRTVGKAIESAPRKVQESEDPGVDFVVERVRLTTSVPPLYEITIDGKQIELTASDLIHRGNFQLRFLEVMRRIPRLPGDNILWRNQANAWLAQAEIEETPPEASAGVALRQEIDLVVRGLSAGEKVADLNQGRGYMHDGRLVFKTRTVLKVLKETYREVSPHVLSVHLKALGYESKTMRLEGSVERVWHKPSPAEPSLLPPEPEPVHEIL